MKQSLRLGTISGIPVGLHWGLLVIAFLYLTNLATGLLPTAVPGAAEATYWLVALAGVLLFFASILAHEIGHSLVAQRDGIRVRAITLWLLGGVAELEEEARDPGSEFRIAAAGPAVSLLLAVGFFGVGLAWDAAFGASVLSTMVRWLGIINGLLAVFNLIPAAPLDGGRILAAALWWRSGDAYLARARAAVAGQGFGMALTGLGVYSLFNGGSVVLVILGWFLLAAATAERRRAELFSAAAHASVGTVMAPLASPTDGAVTVAGLHTMVGSRPAAFPVRGPDGTVIGIVPTLAMERLHQKHHRTTRAGDIAVPWTAFVAARVGEPLTTVIDRFRESGEFHALVYDDWGHMVGYVGLAELGRARQPTPA